MTAIRDREPVGLIAALHPGAPEVFRHHGVDVVRWGGATLGDVCTQHGLDAASVREQLERSRQEAVARPWETRPTPELIDHITTRFHTPLIRLLPRLHVQLRESLKIFKGPGRRRLRGLVAFFARYRETTESHIFKEEDVLFPWLRAGRNARALAPLHVVRMEHQQETWLLAELRRRAEGCGEPAEAHEAWARVLREVEALRLFQEAHRDLEDEVLFSRALDQDHVRTRR
ncbi:MAG: hemerythrin domain-containing protein [Myxococcota bacterium]